MNVAAIFDPSSWLSQTGGPRYIQLKRMMEEAIINQRLAPGTPLPSEREIAAMTGLSRVTVRKAVGPLVDDGLIVQRRGSGTTIAKPVEKSEQSLSLLTSFTEDMARRGKHTSSTWLSRGVFMPSPEETMTLGLGVAHFVSRLTRFRMADGMPLAIERTALSTEILPDPFDVETSLYETLGTLGRRPVRAIQRVTAINLGAEDAGLLEVKKGEAGLQILRVSYLETGVAVELTKSVYRGDAYDVVTELKLPEEA